MTPTRYLLYPIAWLYGAATWVRNKSYDSGIMRSAHFEIPIICVGNLSTGGTGKSPHVHYLANWLGQSKNIVILSRGYGRKTTGYLIVDPNGSPQDFGDEPLELARNLNNATVVVCEDRPVGVKRILEEYPETELIIMDDGFQHRALTAGFNIVLTPYNNTILEDRLLPVGNLRELRDGAKRADLIVVTKVPNNAVQEELTELKMKMFEQFGTPVLTSRIAYDDLAPVFPNTNTMSLKDVKNCILITGIADPKPLFGFLEEHCNILGHIKWPDHHLPSRSDLEKARSMFSNFAGLEHSIITTEKDAIRLLSSSYVDVIEDLPIHYLKMKAQPLEEEEFKRQIRAYVG